MWHRQRIIPFILLFLAVGCQKKNESVEHSQVQAVHVDDEDEFYQCPMHPQVTSEKPGTCPICHMDLRKVRRSQVSLGPKAENAVPDRVEVILTQEQEQLAEVRPVEVKPRGKVVAVPQDAVLYSDQGPFVYVRTSIGHYVPVPVKTGVKSNGEYEILEGLKMGTVVAGGPNFLLDSESRIRGTNK